MKCPNKNAVEGKKIYMFAERFGLGIKIWKESACSWKLQGWGTTWGKCGGGEKGLVQNLKGRGLCKVGQGSRGRMKVRNVVLLKPR